MCLCSPSVQWGSQPCPASQVCWGDKYIKGCEALMLHGNKGLYKYPDRKTLTSLTQGSKNHLPALWWPPMGNVLGRGRGISVHSGGAKSVFHQWHPRWQSQEGCQGLPGLWRLSSRFSKPRQRSIGTVQCVWEAFTTANHIAPALWAEEAVTMAARWAPLASTAKARVIFKALCMNVLVTGVLNAKPDCLL